jgi:hypothetical protein
MNRYQDVPLIRLGGKQCYATTKYPEVPLSENDLYVYTVQGDRFDSLSYQYYNDQSLWWIISIANTAVAGTSLPSDLPQDSLLIPEGSQIRIPANYPGVLNTFKLINKL